MKRVLIKLFFFCFLSIGLLFAFNQSAMAVTGLSSDGLVASWPFNGNANDESGNGNDGVVYGATLTTDRFGNPNKAYSFSRDRYIIVPTLNNMPVGNTSRTLSTWVRINSLTSGDTVFNYGTNVCNEQCGIRLVYAPCWQFSFWGCDGGYDLDTQTSPELNKWIFIVMTYDQNSQIAKVYQDGVEVYRGTRIPNTVVNVDGLTIGRLNQLQDGTYYKFDGDIDDIRIYNRSLSDEEIQNLYNIQNNQPPVLDTIENQSIYEGQPLQFTVSASDPDGNALTYSADGLPTGAAFDQATGAFSWMPDNTQAGSYTVTFSVSDGTLTDTEEITITVLDLDEIPPTITGAATTSPNAAGWYNSNVTVHFEASDSGSGVDSVTPDTVLSSDGAGQSVTGTAVDKAGNSATFTVSGINIDKTSPVITIDTPQDYAVLPAGTALIFSASDALSGVSGNPVGHLSNGTTISSGEPISAGIYTLEVEAVDAAGNTASESRYFVVYDPSGGFVTGGGWINSPEGAYTLNTALSGKATFGLVSKYLKGANVPSGNTQFQFEVAGMNFKSTSYEWLVIAGAKAQYKGLGTINGEGEYGFILTAVDGQINGGGGEDKFRIKIWDKASEEIIYDNQMGAAEDAEPATVLGGGSIVIHKG